MLTIFRKWLIVFVPAVLLLGSCERAIEFTPQNREPLLVVEGTIESSGYPVVYLSRSLGFFSSISLELLSASFVRDAEVTVSDGTRQQRLTGYTIPVDGQNSIFYYAADSTNPSSFRGEEGGSYTLTITAGGKTYTASTVIPVLNKTIDSLYYEEYVDDEDSSRVVLFGKFTDPPGYGNYIRYFTSVNSELFLPGLNSVYDDQVIDGTSYIVQVEKGINRNETIDFAEYAYFHRGDSITVKFTNIDQATFDFWRTVEYSYASIGNPFSSPTRVSGNISNGALGYFGGYAVQYAGILIPE